MQNGQTGTDMGKPRGYIDWPMMFAGNGSPPGGDSDNQSPVTIPSQGFNKIIRCSYWINAYNPIGAAGATPISAADLYYTVSVGWGPDVAGQCTKQHKTASIRHSSRLITVSDGVYMGRQGSNQLTPDTLIPQANCRIGYRHRGPKGPNTVANVGFADGHCEAIDGFSFPQSKDLGLTILMHRHRTCRARRSMRILSRCLGFNFGAAHV